MRVAVISDIHANLPALEAVAEAIERGGARRGLVSRRPRRLRAAAERVLRVGAGARRSLPRRATTTSACSARSTSTTSPRRGRRGRWTRTVLDADARAFLARLAPERRRRRRRALPRQPARPGLGVRAPWEAARDAIRDSGTELDARRPQPRPAGDRRTAARRDGGHAPGRHGDRPARRPLAAQPRLGRPAARRRPARRLAAARPRRPARVVPARRRTTSRRTQEEIRAAGLPDALAERLAHGV